MREHMIQIDAKKCIGCGLCRKDCPLNNISIKNKKAVLKTQNCIKCGHCLAVCPKAVVSLTGFDQPPEEIKGPVVLEPDQLLKAIKTRRSIRQFKNTPVSTEVIEKIIEAGRYTPTGRNAQGVTYIVLKDNIGRYEKIAVHLFRRLLPGVKLINKMLRSTEIDDHFFFKNAGAVIMILSGDKLDGALAASNMELMAEACGLGVLYSGLFTIAASVSPSLRRELGLRRRDKVVTTLVIGSPDVIYRRTVQKDKAVVRRL